ncbi:uncharacterized protein LOC127838585 [Dreissena polymorpha]|uniref:Uncharacterized protein n=1 Tax=Dreissena polymorpha TaxID=45954 RepID=A0A9D4RXG8_DREPO|nr:uncharacterized protein LOC127838585 [Dreissena polymorpha]XP_052222381.1 uncharacterized protein LOC127838585 [Dreissena polymorpha]KAH3884911.1 hypothetical protein DPMN_008897 [Dreissena polymorpha]
MTTMESRGEWGYESSRPVKSAHKISLVSPRMDVDITGISTKNVRTHLIDHPRDEGLKQREQLWNFQQRYRGASVGRFRNLSGSNEDEHKSEQEIAGAREESVEEDIRPLPSARGMPGDQLSLASRFKKRLHQRNVKLTGVRSKEIHGDTGSAKHSGREVKEEDKQAIQRLYSSGLVVKNTLYNQLRCCGNNPETSVQCGDNSKILEAIHKFGSLERLPDIQYPGTKSAHPQNLKFLKKINSYNKRVIDHITQRKYFPLRRSLTNFSDLGPRKRKIIIVARRNQHDDRLLKVDCMDSSNDDDDMDIIPAVDDRSDEERANMNDDDEEEYDEEMILSTELAEKMHMRDREQHRHDHVDIKHNVTHINTQDDMVLAEKHSEAIHKGNEHLRMERTFFCDSVGSSKLDYLKGDVSARNKSENGITSEPFDTEKCRINVRESWNNTKVGTKATVKEANKDHTHSQSRSQTKQGSRRNNESTTQDTEEIDDGLDIPEDRIGPTTHSIDKKLAIRRPWEWKPSPYRWTDKPYVKESDKPYIERIINRGEIIDEYDYDSFARTRPLKVQAFPDGAGYKDRNGVMR